MLLERFYWELEGMNNMRMILMSAGCLSSAVKLVVHFSAAGVIEQLELG